MTALTADVVVADRDVRVRLEVGEGETVALVGPNGAGKSTVLQAVTGLVTDAGEVTLDGRDVRRVPPHGRGIGFLAQEALLFPHLTVLDNVAFGPRSGGLGRAASREVARDWLRRVDAEQHAGRRPSQLSGGQAQRVAVARALATDPGLLLLDEPMAALDVAVRPALRRLLAEVLVGRSAVIVTHDVVDALALADRVVVVESGRVVESGPTRAVLTRPRSEFGARLGGLNRVTGRWDGTAVTSGTGSVSGRPAEDLHAGDDVVALFPPAAVRLAGVPGTASAVSTWRLRVEDVDPFGDRLRVHARDDDVGVAFDVAVGEALGLDLTPGAPVEVEVDPGAVVVQRIEG